MELHIGKAVLALGETLQGAAACRCSYTIRAARPRHRDHDNAASKRGAAGPQYLCSRWVGDDSYLLL